MHLPICAYLRSFLPVLAALLLLAPLVRSQTATVTTVARLGGDPDGFHPQAPPIDGGDGFFYGTTDAGGPANLGTIYKVSPDGSTFTTIYLFTGVTDGANPVSALTAGGDGNFYGTTPGGYPYGTPTGTIFRVTPAGVLTTLHAFSAVDSNYDNTDGAYPVASLVLGSDGFLYGTTETGGPKEGGTIFRMALDGTFTTLATLDGTVSGGVFGPTSALVEGTDGNFYGGTPYGGTGDAGSIGYGTIYRVTPGGVVTLLYSFQGDADGYEVDHALVLGKDGNLYGTTSYGGANGPGTLFQVTPAGVLTTLHSFSSTVEGVAPCR